MSSIRVLLPAEFPAMIREINDPPKKLHLIGELPTSDVKYLTVVGARRYTSYGKDTCEKIIAGLTGYPISIVSGLALGIDGIAHNAALSAGLHTIAVPGSGLSDNVLYPSTHKRLAKEIISAGGALLSEFEPDFRATKWSFPQRNRIMAGMSHAVLVIEAQEKSGTLITSRLATEYNRDVCTVPGSIFSKNSAGPHMLIRLGATPVRSAEDILEVLHLKTDEENSKATEKDYSDCSPEELKIISLLSSEPLERDELIRASSFSITQANTILSLMEIKGLVKESGGKICLT